MLKKLQLTNFKSFAGDAAPIPFAPVTILVGANGSGKSNVLDAILFLQGIGAGLSVAEILTGKWEGGREVFPAMRGGSNEVCWAGETTFSICTDIEASPPDSAKLHMHHEMRPRVEPVLAMFDESVDTTGGRCRRQTDFAHPSKEGVDSKSILLDEDANKKNPDLAKLLEEYRSIRFLDVRPSMMKDYVPLAVPELGTHGENLSTIAYRIGKDTQQKESYLAWLGALCAPPVTDIDFDITGTGDVMVKVVEGDGVKKPITARSISDGTLRFMGILAAMFSAPEGSLFLMEEIENGLHPTRVHLLVELLEQFAESRNLQIIATTHSSQVLLGLSDRALRNAVLFARNEEMPGTVTRRLGDLPDFEEVTEKTQIDRLFTTGWLEQAL